MASNRWHDFLTALDAAPGRRAGNILDVRPPEAFRGGHVRGSAHHSLEPAALADPTGAVLGRRLPSIFLPPRHEPLVVIAARPDEAERLAAHLAGRERARVDGLAYPDTAAPPEAAELIETGAVARFLWKPPPWLERHTDLLPPPAAGPVLDLACGSGRAAVWLAIRGYRVTGIDWQAEALQLGRQLAASRRATCRFLAADLRDPGTVPRGPWSVVLNFRFRQPELLAMMPDLLQPGGVALVRTFREAPGYDGHPSPCHRLAPGELFGYFPAGTCEVLAHEESHDPDGRPAAGIVARKKISRRRAPISPGSA